MYVFPYLEIKKDEKILIYGYGRVGKDYEYQIHMTDYCKIVAFVDKQACALKPDTAKIISVAEIRQYNFDKILIAVARRKMQSEVFDCLCNAGIPEHKIVRPDVFNNENIKPDIEIVDPIKDEIVHIGLVNSRGLGDAVINIVLAQKFRDLFGNKIYLVYITEYKDLFQNNYLFDEVRADYECVNLDLLIHERHVFELLRWSPEKIQRQLPLLYDFCTSSTNFINKKISRSKNAKDVWIYARFFEKTRMEVCDMDGILGVSKHDKVLFTWNASAIQTLRKYGIYNKKYVVVNRDIDAKGTLVHPKLWSTDSYNRLLKLIKSSYKDLLIVKVGADDVDSKMEDIDIDLSGQTSLDELKVILKYSILLISSEGGLVHINHFLYKKSAVIFGPTDEKYFGHDQDLKFVDRWCCGLPCNYMQSQWMRRCIKDYDIPMCMQSVRPEKVYEGIKPYIDEELSLSIIRIEMEYDLKEFLQQYESHAKSIAFFGDDLEGYDHYLAAGYISVKMYQSTLQNSYSAYAFWGNLPEYESCYDLIVVGSEICADHFALVMECFRLLKTSGILVIHKTILADVPSYEDVELNSDDYVIMKRSKDQVT